MPSFSVGFAQVEARLHSARRRLNLLTLQDALYRSGTVVVLVATLVMVLTLRGQSVPVSRWAAAGAVVAALAAAALRIRHRWMSADQMVRFADRAGALDDRLATLLVDPARAHSSRLKDLLLEQILAATPRWRIDMLAPRRVPRSLFLLVGSMAALVVAAFLARAPANAKPASGGDPYLQAMRSGGGTARTGQGVEVVNEGHEQRTGPGDQLGGAPAPGQRLGQRGPAPGSGQPTGQDGGAAPGASASGAPPDAGAPGRQPSAPGKSTAVESADRAAGLSDQRGDSLQAPLDAGDQRDDRPEGGPARGETERTAPRGIPHRAELAGRGEPSAPNRPTRKDPHSSTTQPPSDSASFPLSGSAATAGAHTSGSAELFGGAIGASPLASGTQKVSIKLGALGAASPSQMEPQRQEPPIAPGAANFASRSAIPALANEQTPDAALQKAEVAPEHEALVRQIFTRDE